MNREEYIAICTEVADTFAQTYLKMFHGEMTEADADALFMSVLLEQKVPADTEYGLSRFVRDMDVEPFYPFDFWMERIQSMFSGDEEREAFWNWFEEREKKRIENQKAEAEAWEHDRRQRKAKLLAEYRAKHPESGKDDKGKS